MNRLIGCFAILLVLTMFVGEIRCGVKMLRCNWSPIGKAEVLYTIGTFTGTGCVIGWFDIQDN